MPATPTPACCAALMRSAALALKARASASPPPPTLTSASSSKISHTHTGHTALPPPRAALRDETPEQARERRLRESQRVEERVVDVVTVADFERELAAAGGKLVVLEAQSESVCMTGLDEEPELHWKADREAALQPCVNIKHTFARTARECPDVVFLSLQVDDEDAQELCDELGIDVVPTMQFWRGGAKLWEHKGAANMDTDLGEGVLFFDGAAAGGVRAQNHVAELRGEADVRAFVASQPDSVLTVVDVSTSADAPCIRVFPAVLALARSFEGYAAFGRVLADASDEGRALLRDFGIVEVPTFLFFKGGREVERHVGSSRGDLIGRILEVQARFGVAPPPPPPGGAQGQQRRAIQRRVTRRKPA